MQESLTSLSWKQIAFGFVASFLGGGGAFKLFNTWLNRNKPAAEIHLTESTAEKTRAEARKINAEADVQFTAIVERLHVRLEEMAAAVVKIREERDDLKLRVELQQLELNMRDKDIKKLKGVLDARSIKLSDFEEPR